MKNKNNNRLTFVSGGYKDLEAYKNTTIIYDFTVAFCKKYKPYLTYKTYEQMTGAARSGRQNIAEGSIVSGTSKKSELKLVNVARGSLEELLLDYEDFLRQNDFQQWEKGDRRAVTVRRLAYGKDRTYKTYMGFLRKPEEAANAMLCLINQTNYLLDKLIKRLEKDFEEEGGFTERMYKRRKNKRGD